MTWRCARRTAAGDVILGNGGHLAYGNVLFLPTGLPATRRSTHRTHYSRWHGDGTHASLVLRNAQGRGIPRTPSGLSAAVNLVKAAGDCGSEPASELRPRSPAPSAANWPLGPRSSIQAHEQSLAHPALAGGPRLARHWPAKRPGLWVWLALNWMNSWPARAGCWGNARALRIWRQGGDHDNFKRRLCAARARCRAIRTMAIRYQRPSNRRRFWPMPPIHTANRG